MNMLEALKDYPSIHSILMSSELLDLLPCGLSIATDFSCEAIIHNTAAANFLRIDPFGFLSHSAKEPPLVNVYEAGRLLRPEEMPMQQAAWYGKEIRNCTLEFVWQDGIAKTARWSANPLRDKEGNITGCIATMEDISDGISADKELHKHKVHLEELVQARTAELKLSEELFAQAFHNNQTPMAILATNGVFIDVNNCYAEMLGFNREDVIGKSNNELNFWVDIEEQTKMRDLLLEKGCFKDYETRFKSNTSEIGFALSSGSLINFNDEPCFIFSSIDITDRKKAEEALLESQALFYKAFNTNPLPMAITKKKGIYIDVNKNHVKRYGYTREEMIGFTVADINIWADKKERDKCIAEIEGKGFFENFETRVRAKSGEIFNVLLSGVSIVWNNEPCILTIANDITPLMHYQQKMARLDQLNLVGEMAAGIGHEIRNPMTTVRGFLQLLGGKERYTQDKEFMNLMIEELDRCNAIITEYLTMAKDKLVELKRQSLNQKIRAIMPLFQADAMKQDKSIEVELNTIPYLVIDGNEIKQLILNLVRNGLEAMPPGGLLTIKTYQADNEVVLSVQDQGSGIAPEVLEKIGTPFFTTKDNGTGLGLAVCYSIAQRNNAKIDIKTSASGTTFYVLFRTKNGTS